jgi:hypothetical protein
MPAAPSSPCPSPRPASGVQCGVRCERPVSRLPVHRTAVQCPVRASERPGVHCPASGVGVRCLCVAASAVSGRSEVLERGGGAGSRMAGMAGVGVVARWVHARLVVCLRRRLVLEAGAGGAGPAEASVWTWPSSSGGGWAVASSTAWPTRIGRVHVRIIRWWSRCTARLASCGRLIGMRRANRSAGLQGGAQHQEANRTHPVSKAELNSSSIYQTLLNLFSPPHLPLRLLFGFSVLLSTRICHAPSCYPHGNSSRLHIRICDARLPPWWRQKGRAGWRCR